MDIFISLESDTFLIVETELGQTQLKISGLTVLEGMVHRDVQGKTAAVALPVGVGGYCISRPSWLKSLNWSHGWTIPSQAHPQ